MKKLLLLAVLTPLLALAQGPFDGTWRIDLKKVQAPKKPDTFLLQNGMYSCSTCVPKIDVKADGTDQKVTGSPYIDTLNVRIVDARTVEQVEKKAGKTINTFKGTVSPDGKTLTMNWTSQMESATEPVSGTTVLTRVAPAPPGAHEFSGSWRTEKFENISENALVMTFKELKDELTVSSQTGQSYTAKFDGKEYPYKGDPGIQSVSLKRINPNTIEETDKRDGKVVSVMHMTVNPDGKTMKYVVNDKLRDTTMELVAEKQ